MLAFDIESDGLLEDITTVHCIHVANRVTGKRYRFNNGKYRDGSPAARDGSIEEGLHLLMTAPLDGHNIIGYDIPALKKLYPWFKPQVAMDTLVSARVIWTDLTDKDFSRLRSDRLPREFQSNGLIGSHSLEAWGYRLGEYKGDFKPESFTNPLTGEPHTWATIGFTKEMDDYCAQDVEVTVKLVNLIESKRYSRECLDLEHAVATIIRRQEMHGFAFDVENALKLTVKLQKRKAELEYQLIQTFAAWWAPDGPSSGIRPCKKSRKVWEEHPEGKPTAFKKYPERKCGWFVEYTEGSPYTAIKLLQFNPGSRDHIANRLTSLFGWRPVEFTDGGKPKVDETTLAGLTFPEAKLLNEYLMVEKRIGQVADGDNAWLKRVRGDRMHGRVNTNGAVTGRMTHNHPNVAQTPAVGAPYGAECRALFMASLGCVLVGCDAEGLELRMLAHYMAKYDGGAYVDTVVNGRKEDKTDVHSVNQAAAGLNKRDNAKTLVYAFLYGAGDYKLGTIVLDDMTDDKRACFFEKYPAGDERDAAIKRLGKKVKARFLDGLPALKELIASVKKKVKAGGTLMSLDKRILSVRSEHAALNTLLQGGGAVVMKKALVLLDEALVAKGLRNTSTLFDEKVWDYEFVANVHDEFQIDTKETIAKDIGTLAAASIRRAGEYYGLRCPLSGAYEVGKNWKETH